MQSCHSLTGHSHVQNIMLNPVPFEIHPRYGVKLRALWLLKSSELQICSALSCCPHSTWSNLSCPFMFYKSLMSDIYNPHIIICEVLCEYDTSDWSLHKDDELFKQVKQVPRISPWLVPSPPLWVWRVHLWAGGRKGVHPGGRCTFGRDLLIQAGAHGTLDRERR